MGNKIYNICSNNPQLIKRVFASIQKEIGPIKYKNIKKNKADVLNTHGDNLKIKHFNNSNELITFEKATDTKSVLKIGDIPVLTWDLRNVKKHQANFYQVLGLGTKPFHYYIVLYNNQNFQ